ncbi:uncharacterized protein A4U43_C08F6630 [Asparagus officinalis]|nr:uncharacterized protein A4U43_C08F6630 [Asparagus officinalis]
MKKHEGSSRKNVSGSFRRFRETQSNIAMDAFGRRSCDLGPRFSLDAGRISFKDSRIPSSENSSFFLVPWI